MLLKTTAHLSWENFYLRKFCFFIISLTLVSIHVYAQSGAWKLIDSLPTPRVAMMQACLVNGKIYFIGGTDDASTLTGLATNEVYNPLADTWEKKQPMPTSRCFLTTVVVNGTIYAIGGNWPSIKTVEAYDPVTDSWTKKADMLSPRNEMQAGVVNGIIYVMSGSGETRNCMAYNPITNQWIEKSKRPEVGGPVAVAVYNNLVYTFGGTFGPQGPVFSTVYAYDPQTDTWVKKKDMPTPRFAFQTLLCKGKIYAMGGTQGGTAGYGTSLSNVEVYDPATDTWEIKPNMPFKGAYLSGAVVNGKIYITQGTPDWATGGIELWEYDPAFHTDIAAGNVSGIWTKANSPYYINGEITIPKDSTLTIESGVDVVFTGHYKFNVQGRLLSLGTKKDSISFTAENKQAGWHGIRFVRTPSTNDTSKISYCKFTYGKANTGEWGSLDRAGGAILISEFDKVEISNCFFKDNLNEGEMWETGGAAIFIKQASPIVTKSTFQGNTGGYSDFAIKCVYASKAIISYNVISHSTGEWDAIVCEHSAENRPLITGNIISHNVSRQGGGGIGFYRTSNARIENNVIVHNSGVGGGIVCSVAGSPTIINNTIAFNSASKGGGGIVCRRGSNPILINNILYGNSAPVGCGPQVGLDDDAADPVILYCNIQGGKEGFGGSGAGSYYTGLYVNNIDSDPLFVNTASDNYRLATASPCIGAGIDSAQVFGNLYHAPSFCIMGNTRPSPSGSKPDIGACESLLGSPVLGINQELRIPVEFNLYQNYPNPFNPTTTIGFGIPASPNPSEGGALVKLKVYDVLGNEVKTLVNEEMEAGYHSIDFNASELPSGVYLYRIQFGNFIDTKKMILLR